ncbi:MAG: Proteasome subunit beta type-7 [Piccolia ochrophora]|nr:MAG: Proteasome subunit beta type-7 [Piccolia ochrophora]
MLGLNEYSSSDEEGSKSVKREAPPSPQQAATQFEQQRGQDTNGLKTPSRPSQEDPPSTTALDAPTDLPEVGPSTGPPTGPMVGPSRASPSPSAANGTTSSPQSPYTAARSLIRDLTLPPQPDLDIPPSPPGSPLASTNAKFALFLELKKQGVHFNEKLAKSSALKNPSILPKLMAFAGMDERSQYASSLPKEVWDPDAFPTWAYKDGLAAMQQETHKKKEAEKAQAQRDAIDFVPATASGDSSRSGTPGTGIGNRGVGRSAAERVMAGLGQERTKSPLVPEGRSKREMERRGGKYENYRNRERKSVGTNSAVGADAQDAAGRDEQRQRLEEQLRPRDDVYGPYDHSYLQQSGPNQHTQAPIVTGTSVIAAKFKEGVVIAADNLASYGSLARFTDVKRLLPFADTSIVGIGGDVSDLQHLSRLLNSLDVRESYSTPSTYTQGPHLNAKNLHTYLSKVMYKRRSDFNPLWNAILVAGLDSNDKPFLSSVDLLGTTFSAPTLATGFGAHLAQPILRRLVEDEEAVDHVTQEAALETVKECMKVLFYRDARSMDRYSIAVVTKEGIDLKQDEKLEGQSWAFAEGIRGYGTQNNEECVQLNSYADSTSTIEQLS